MIRLLFIAVALLLLWVVFMSGFSKKHKIWVVVAAMIFSVFAMWLESNWQQPKKDLVQASDVVDCGTTAGHSYRSSFDLIICLRNQADIGHVKRVNFDVIAKRCAQPEACIEIERVARELSVDLPAQSDLNVKQNLSFNLVDPAASDVVWSVEVKSVRATAK